MIRSFPLSFNPLRASVIEGAAVYYIGIIDILQDYNWTKWFEYKYKTLCSLSRSGRH